VAFTAKAGVVDYAIVPDAGDDILQDAARGFVKQHVIGDDGRHPRLRCFESISDLLTKPRAPLALRFGPELGRRLDQATGRLNEPIDPVRPP
jgi:hypothetical protein